MGSAVNPFANDPDRHEIWEMLVNRDIEAFLARDWSRVESDFVTDAFFGLHAHFMPNPDDWTMAFADLGAYRDEWLYQAEDTAATSYAEPLAPALFRATDLSVIEILGDRALARKKFHGVIARAEGGEDKLDWQTLYICAKRDGRWKIASFVGYMPREMGK